MNDQFIDIAEAKGDDWCDRQGQLLEQLAPSQDYNPAIAYFRHFTYEVPQFIEKYLDGYGYGFEGYHSCNFPVVTPDDDSTSPVRGITFIEDFTFGDEQSKNYHEFLMPYSEFLRWLRAQARLWSEIFPSDEAALIHT